MSTLEHKIRSTIVDALQDVDALQHMDAARVAAFEEGLEDVSLAELGLDSLMRMELLVALEMEHEAVVSPSAFAEFLSLDDIVACVERAAPDAGVARDTDGPHCDPAHGSEFDTRTECDQRLPRIARLFRRGFRTCQTVAEMNWLLTQLSDRMTPLEASSLRELHQLGQLLPDRAAPKFETALSDWCVRLDRAMHKSGKAIPEPFNSRRISPAAMHYTGPGKRADKTLLICFSAKGYRTLSIAQTSFLQHIDASQHDVLIISDLANTAFRAGVPMLGANVYQVVRWVADLPCLAEYASLRVVGCSAGVYPATLAGRRVGAELTVGLNGRFPSERHLGTLIRMHVSSWLASLRHPDPRVLLVHGVTRRRDIVFARRLRWLTGASRLAIEMPDRHVEHNVLPPILEHGELKQFLDLTLFGRADSELFAEKRTSTTLRFPSD